jgi:anti-sigma regulatory factor (Ser/Thr protein kinase)
VREAVAFIEEAVRADEPVLVLLPARRIAALRAELPDPPGIRFADMEDLGSNPARIIPAWRAFVDETPTPGGSVRGIGQSAWPDRPPAELAECQRHEELVNVAFRDEPRVRLLCPYDARALPDVVLEEARRSHPVVWEAGQASPSRSYPGVRALSAPFDRPLPAPRGMPDVMAFGDRSLEPLRSFVREHAHAAGLHEAAVDDLVLSAHEAAANSIRHGGGGGSLSMWREDGAVICDVRDDGMLDEPLAGRKRPSWRAADGRGLWLANQLCDLVQIRSGRTGSVVRIHMRLR